jgi:hypothetical protein
MRTSLTHFTAVRQRIISQGMNPEHCRDYVARTVKVDRDNFEIIRCMLSKEQAASYELEILNAEIMLSILNNACLVKGLL